MNVLVVNPGSSSLKLSLLDGENQILSGWSGPPSSSELSSFLKHAPPVGAAGVRIVHGGARFSAPQLLDDDAVGALGGLVTLAPLHMPAAIEAICSLRRAEPDMAVVGCFDTAFHTGMPEEATVYAIPWEWSRDFGIRRYGFHGLSHSYASRRGAELMGRPLQELRIVSCHLGAGASLAAVRGGRSVDTTMGFTPMEGLVMATRSGSLDPGLLIWLLRNAGITLDQLEEALDRRSGLAGLSGLAQGDITAVIRAAEDGDDRAALALAVYLHRLRAGIAAMVAAMGGLDAIIFTGGVGENAAEVRKQACDGLAFLGIALDQAANATVGGDADISPSDSRVRTLVIRAREDLEIARQVRTIMEKA